MKKRIIRYLILMLIFLPILGTKAPAFAEEALLTATASSCHSIPSYEPAKAIDGDKRTFWAGAKKESPWWLMVDAGRVANLKEIEFNWHGNYSGKDFDIQVSRDGSIWENVHSGLDGRYKASQFKIYDLSSIARYVRIYIRETKGNRPAIPEIKIYTEKKIPKKMRFQGRLKSSDGSDVDEDGLKITFRVYIEETGGLPLWTETQEDIEVEDGLLDAVLGSVEELNLAFDMQYYLGVEVEDDEEMSPRFALTTAPYAFSSE